MLIRWNDDIMTTILQPAGPWQQAASACFTLAGWFGDILIIRIFLFLAYVWLLTGAVTGYQRWPLYAWSGSISLDGLIWSSINCLVHFAAILQLLWDERPISFTSEDEQQVYHFLYRRGGCEGLEAKAIISRGTFRRVPANEMILNPVEATKKLVLLIEGKARCTRRSKDDAEGTSAPFLSGMMSDKSLLNIVGVYTGFEKDDVSFEVVAEKDCLVIEWTLEMLDAIATRCGPSVAAYFRNFVLCQFAIEMEFRSYGIESAKCSSGILEDPSWLQGARSRDFCEPLEEPPHQGTPVWRAITRCCTWVFNSLTPKMPPGIRHKALPISGLAARRRLLTYSLAEKRRLKRQQSLFATASGLIHRLSSRRHVG